MDAALANGIGAVLSYILSFIQLIIVASVIVSWVNADRNNQIVQVIYRLSEPIYRPIRRLMGGLSGPIDWSPIIIFLIILFLQKSVVAYLLNYGKMPM